LYHVLSRGNERKDIFHDDRDRLTFLDVIGEMSDQYHVDILAYILMGNHYHILLRTNHANLSKSMQWLALTYTRRFNNRACSIIQIDHWADFAGFEVVKNDIVG